MSQRSKLTKDQFVEELARLCKSGESGTVFVVTHQNHQAKIILREGAIVAAFLRPLSGIDVISELAKQTEVSFAFNNNLLMDATNQVLPDTKSLINFLRSSSIAAGGIASLAGDSGDIDLDKFRQVLIEEATEYLGPIARPICEEYLAKIPAMHSNQQLFQVITLVQKDISDVEKEGAFYRSMRSRLRF